MTQPIESPISTAEDNASQRYENQTKNSLVGQLIELTSQIIKDLIKAEAIQDEELLQDEVVRIVSQLNPTISKADLNKVVLAGMKLGTQQAGEDEDQDIPTIPMTVAKLVSNELYAYTAVIRDTVKDAKKLARTEDVTTVLAAVKAVESKAERFAATVSARSQAEGVIQVAKSNGSKLIWVHEQKACLHCLAYTGHVVEPGESFGLRTFDAKPLNINSLSLEHPEGIVAGPSLHPHCRCRLRVWNGPDPRDPADIPRNNNNVTFAEALQREARRAVLRGDSDYASLNAKLKAADKLLSIGANLPPSVEKRAKVAVNKGNFSRVGKK